MDDKNRVVVTSHQKGEFILKSPENRFTRSFANAGSTHKIDKDIIEDLLMNDPGTQYAFQQGLLSIDSKEDRVAVGLEEDETDVAIVVLDRNTMVKMIKGMPFAEFKTTMDKATSEQRRLVAELAVELNITDLEKATYIKKLTNIDVLKRIEIAKDKLTPAEVK